MIGRAVSHYRVLSALGSGGMGVVYLAEDERLGRQVALKFLPPDSVKNRQALDRFRVEARAASSLSHPGICAIFDIGDDEGTPFIVMEALKGETLRDRINRGPIKVADLVDIGIQLADALEAAHTQGIIHRDIKPSNIFIGEKNRVKILDFGLAKLSSGSGATDPNGRVDASTHQTIVKQLTQPGSALGTVSYMSPEQARGEDVDTRTDLFSLGAVLYEMATGSQAFGGSTPAVVFDAILNHTPPVLIDLNPLVPPRLEAIIITLLEKDRELRYQHASDLQAELKRLRRDLDSGTVIGVASSRTVISTPAAASRSHSISRLPSTSRQPATDVEPPPPRGTRWWPYAISVLALFIVAAFAYTIWSGRAQPTAPAVTQRAATETPAPPPASPAPAPVETTPVAPPPPAPSAPAPRTPTTDAAARGAAPSRGAPDARQPVSIPPTRGATATPSEPPRVPTTQASPIPAPPQVSTPAPTAPPQPTPQAQTPPPVTETPVAPPAPQPQPTPARAAEPPVVPPPAPRAAAPSEIPPTSPVESDDAAIRRVVNTYKNAIETKSVALFRSVRPGLTAAEETRLRESFRQVDSQQVTIAIDEIRVDGRTATARLSRQDVIMSGGRRQTQASRQTMRFEKTATGWVITAIGS